MAEVPYDRWAYFIFQKIEEVNIKPSSWILDIGAGTGVVAEKISALFNVIALDISREMLQYANLRENLKCIQANMISLPFASNSVAAAYSTHDCINYLTNDQDIVDHLKDVYRVLKKNGIYIIDFSTEYNVLKNFHDKTFEEKHGNIKMKWSNIYDPLEKIITSTIDIKISPDKIWNYLKFWKSKKFREVHRQRIFSEEKMNELCAKTRFKTAGKTYDYKNITDGKRAHLAVYILQKN
jgi:ubiquinone/menaquinone biosynthesis C-methylase UbiE